MTSSTFTKVAMSAMLVLATLCSYFAAAQSIEAPNVVTLSLTSGEGAAVYESNVDISYKACILLPPQTTAFKSSHLNAVIAVYIDNACKTYSYSVEGSLTSLDKAKSLSYDQFDSTSAHTQSITFTDPSVHKVTLPANRTALIAVAVTGAIAFFVFSCVALHCLEKKNNAASKVPQIEITSAGLPLYNNSTSKSQEANAKAISSSASAASSVAYLPAYSANNNPITAQ
ncbi:hypothetical protein BGW39_000511 [Mortierella sp. 14UC]|nr:hypothetical protein BGW39_000511 [Mortierella sp. 14UC]